MNTKRGGIYLANLDPVVGREIAKTRPVIVVSNDKNNAYSGTVTILPITSRHTGKIYPFEVFLPKGAGNLPKNSRVKADQIRTIDNSRIVKFIGQIEAGDLYQVENAMKIHLNLI
jgi:mRNA interferase MazF